MSPIILLGRICDRVEPLIEGILINQDDVMIGHSIDKVIFNTGRKPFLTLVIINLLCIKNAIGEFCIFLPGMCFS